MKELLKRRLIRQFIKFGIVGISSTVIDWGIYLGLTRFLGVFYILAKIISFIFGGFNSYIWNRRWTFRSTEKQRAKQFIKFMIIAGIGLALNTLILAIAVEKCHLSDIYGLILASAVVVLWNFTVNKIWVFKGSEPVVIE